jgi:hypothetical protein
MARGGRGANQPDGLVRTEIFGKRPKLRTQIPGKKLTSPGLATILHMTFERE